MNSCSRFCIRLKTTLFLWGAVASILVALLIPPMLLSLVAPLNAAKQLDSTPTLQHDDRHAIIAIPCPYAPYFNAGDNPGREWNLIATALQSSGREAQSIFVSYEEALRYAKADLIAGVWVCGGMDIPDSGLYPSEPLLERQFVVVTLESRELNIDGINSLKSLAVATHPNIFHVLRPQLGELIEEGDGIQTIPNNLLLATLLTTGKVDALITEKAVFEHSLQQLAEEGQPAKPTKFYELFEPVSPRILFKDRILRDQFNTALRKLKELDTIQRASLLSAEQSIEHQA
jgi:ABC-type amino acid transport substrate-binding protein